MENKAGRKKLSLPVKIAIALAAGVIVGIVCYATGISAFTENYLKPFGTIFVNLLKFIVVPVVLLSIIDGIVSMGDMKKVGSVGVKTLVYFFVTTAVACIIGLVIGAVFNGAGLFPILKLTEGQNFTEPASLDFMQTIVNIFPSNLWDTLVRADMLQVIVIAILFGGAILAAGEKAKLCRDLVTSCYSVIEKLMNFIISVSPIGVFAMIAWVVATQGPQILGSLGIVLLAAYLGYFVHGILCYSMAVKTFAGMNPLKFFRGALPAVIFAFTSASSAASIPLSKECSENLGVKEDVSSFVIPLGATVNMDGTAIYQCIATVFLASCCGMNLTLGQMATVVVTATLASVGTAGVSGAATLMLAMVLTAVGVPVDMIMIIYGIDRIFDMGRTGLNVAGDISCAVCVSKWEEKKAAKLAENK